MKIPEAPTVIDTVLESTAFHHLQKFSLKRHEDRNHFLRAGKSSAASLMRLAKSVPRTRIQKGSTNEQIAQIPQNHPADPYLNQLQNKSQQRPLMANFFWKTRTICKCCLSSQWVATSPHTHTHPCSSLFLQNLYFETSFFFF
jgi:hypothetical protein